MTSSRDVLSVLSVQKGLSSTSAISIERAKPQLIVFGAQTSCPSKEFLAEIRKYLLSETRLGPFLEALKDLPSLWDRLVRHDQLLKAVPGRETLQRLGDWIQHGELPDGNVAESNLFGMPLTLIIHFVQYFHYLDGNTSHVELIQDVSTAGVQGFCIGLLSAIAVACARQEAEVTTLAAVALRLAACIGAYVDLHRAYAANAFDTVSLAVRWKTSTSHDLVLEALQAYPEVSNFTSCLASRLRKVVTDEVNGKGLCFGHIRLYRFEHNSGGSRFSNYNEPSPLAWDNCPTNGLERSRSLRSQQGVLENNSKTRRGKQGPSISAY